ncbi:Glyoxalase/Bleomycin resistance protein/Dihydroxybiphenyl dioxygenase [Fragilariopsis cylindrus CCMP1102]|uniref:Glyoxalase/Bleomycin resistance protein/Dihydroxybiphenyl dioxygenase n=1 Tax=Fragilariopsis cylindrus CCMP1102 TaxID=635003 RepID=A0A1E7EQ28_9STRA|nr:Glyoxalase/Bleomycin resistance protein/Dihydroxybiphenyl dioxygenase [Fragilariopsis cylindrus CCMP1102]|eukprot:OEU08090.1 Glyoxalase/Bleomycin resistance protein/Dihydroxybiphenyl dioxygenase [Fragilariopsis cylindrus CCMP1102]
MTTSTPPTSHPFPISSTTSSSSSISSSRSRSLAIRGIRNGLHTAAVDADVINKVDGDDSLWDSINALTLFTNDMEASCLFYKKLGLHCTFGGKPDSMFSTFSNNGESNNATLHINLELNKDYNKDSPGWGRCVFHVKDVDALYEKAMNAGLQPEFEPTDANWGERYFQILDPMGHEISLAKRIEDHPRWN